MFFDIHVCLYYKAKLIQIDGFKSLNLPKETCTLFKRNIRGSLFHINGVSIHISCFYKSPHFLSALLLPVQIFHLVFQGC